MSESSSEMGLREYLQVIQRRRWIVIEVFAIVVVVVVLGSLLTQPVYRATAALLVESGTPQSGRYDELPIIGTALSVSRIRTLETHRRLLIGRPIIEAVMQEVNLQLTVKAFRKQVSVEAVRDTDIIEIHVDNPKPELAAKVANSIATNYISQNQEYSRESAQSAGSFLEKQLEKIKQDLSAAEQQVEEYKLATGITDLDKEAEQQIEVLGTLTEELARAQAEAQASEARRKAAEQKLSQQDQYRLQGSTQERNRVVEELEIELAKLEEKRAGLLEEYAPQSRQVQTVDAEIQSIKQQLSQQLETVLASTTEEANPVHDRLLIDAANSRAGELAAHKRVTALAQAIRKAEAQLGVMPSKEKELGRLIRAQKVGDKIYTLLLEKYHEIRVAEAMKLSRARLVEPAVTPPFPIRPRTKLNIALACVFGLIVGLLLAALVEYLDDTIKNPEEIDDLLGTAVLGTVPRFSEDDPMLVTEAAPKSALTEAFQTIHANLNFASVDQAVNSMVITSAGPGEGKTFVVANLALTMARQGKQVIAVDSDLRRPTLHKRFGIDNAKGLTTVLASDRSVEEVLVATETEGLRILPSGPIPPNPVELLASDKMMELCQTLANEADLILYDTPPIVMVSDAPTLASQSDGVLLVIEQGGVSRRLVTEVQDILTRAHTRTIGVVLNKVTRQAGHYYYSYYYSYYYQSEEE